MGRTGRTGAVGIPKDRTREIRRIARPHGVVRLRVFGSHATGAATEASDLDLLVDLRPRRDLLDLIGFKLDVEDLLGCKVDVLTKAASARISGPGSCGMHGPSDEPTSANRPVLLMTPSRVEMSTIPFVGCTQALPLAGAGLAVPSSGN